jgi:hypothetical protein
MRIRQNGTGSLDAIGFNMKDFADPLRNAGSAPVDIAYTLEENTWNKKTSLQIRYQRISTSTANW